MSSQPWSLGRLTRKRSDGSSYWSYCIKWLDAAGQRRRVSLGTTDKAAAPALARDFWSRLTTSGAETLGELVPAYMDQLPEGRDQSRKREAWKAASPFFAGLRPDQIDEKTPADYMAWRKRATNTMRHELGVVNSALRWAVKEKVLESAPKVVLPPIPETSVDHLSKDDFRRFLTGCVMPHVKLFAMLAVTTGARATALLELTWDRVDLDRALVDLNPKGRQQTSKGRATVPLNDRILHELRAARDGALTSYVIEVGGTNIKSIKKGVAAAAIRSGVRCHPHMFRHSAAVWMAEDRTPMEEIAAFLGHKNTAITTRVYARFSPDYLRRAARSLDW